MGKYRIPDKHRPVFDIIRDLNSKDIEALCIEVNRISLGSNIEDLIKSPDFGRFLAPEVDKQLFFSTLFSVISLGVEHNNPNELIDDLVRSYQEEGSQNDSEANLREKLGTILGIKGGLKQTIKAYGLATEADKIYLEGRIISDIRLVFDTDINTDTRGAVLVHQLKLTYDTNDETKQIFLLIDNKDLIDLRETIDRALAKERLIVSNAFTKDLVFVNTQD